MILSLYAGMMRAGIPMREADNTDLGRYLRVMAYTARQQEGRREHAAGDAASKKRNGVIMLERGTIDQIMR